MIKLQILKADGSVYWTENFNDVASKDMWLAEEQTRPYWDNTFTVNVEVIEDITTVTPSQDQIDLMRRTAVRTGCLAVVDFIADYNKKNLNDTQLQALFAQTWFSSISFSLLLGAPGTAQTLIQTYGPSVYPQAVVDEVSGLLEPLK